MFDVKTIQAQINETHFVDRAFAILSLVFGAVATLLASIGLFGVTAYAVARRTQEIGIRLALGANRGDIVGLVMREVVIITAAGLVAGVALAIAAGRLVESQMYGVNSGDPAVLAAATLVIAAASILAGYAPCRRATRIDPLVALRYE